MAFLVFAATATETRVISSEFGRITPVGFRRRVVIMITIRAVHMRFGFDGLCVRLGGGHELTPDDFCKGGAKLCIERFLS